MKLGLLVAGVAGVVVAFLVGWFARNAAVRGTDVEVVNAIFGVVGVVANLAMAIAAVTAFFLWQRQLHGTSRHQVAREAMAFGYRASAAVDLAVLLWSKYNPESFDRAAFAESADELRALRGEAPKVAADVRTFWPTRNVDTILFLAQMVRAVFLWIEACSQGRSKEWLYKSVPWGGVTTSTGEYARELGEWIARWAQPAVVGGDPIDVTEEDIQSFIGRWSGQVTADTLKELEDRDAEERRAEATNETQDLGESPGSVRPPDTKPQS